MVEEIERRAPRRWLRRLGLFALVMLILLLGALALVSQRRGIAQSLILARLRSLGLEPASVVVSRFDASGIELRYLRIGEEEDLIVDRIEATYSPESLRALRLAEIRVAGARLHGRVDEEGLSLGALDPLLESEDSGAPLLPAAALTIEDAGMELETPYGPIEASLRSRAKVTPNDRVETQGEFTAELPPGLGGQRFEVEASARFTQAGEPLEAHLVAAPTAFAVTAQPDGVRLEGATPRLSVHAQRHETKPVLRTRVESQGGSLRVPAYGIEARGLALAWALDPDTFFPAGSMGIEEIRDTSAHQRFVPLHVDGSLRPAGEDLAFRFELADASAALRVETSGSYDLERRRGAATLRLHPLQFEPEGRQPAGLFPILAGQLSQVKGSVEAIGSLSWEEGRASSEVDVALRDVGFATEVAEVEGVNGTIRLTGPNPTATPPGQLLSVGRIDFGLELTEGLVRFELRPEGTLALEAAQWDVAGGSVRTAGQLDPKAAEQELVLEVEDVDLGELFARTKLEGLSGSGSLGGHIPLVRRGDVLEIRNATLAADEPGGAIRYLPTPGVAGMAESAAGFDVLLAALENFRYEELELSLNGTTTGTVELLLHLRGANPALEGGRPVEFNLNLEAQLADLLQTGVATYRIPEKIEERLREFSQGADE
jgi:hypothetical protein